MKVWVDPERCRGHALCLTHAPEAFEFIDLEDRSVVIGQHRLFDRIVTWPA